MIFVSVVRDFALYERLVRGNPNNEGAGFVPFDNLAENRTIPSRYNEFLDTYDYSRDAWFVFCHEDFQFLEPLSGKLPLMDKGAIYGSIGARLGISGVGLQVDSNKDGSNACFIGTPIIRPTVADTVDCQCLIVHSTLAARYKLRFDENLTYDLYTEDFCISAFERFGIKTMVLPIRSHHYSYGNIVARFFDQLAYLNTKYADASRVYVTTTAFAIGRSEKLKKVNDKLRANWKRFPKWLFYKKLTHKGCLIVKVLGVPVYHKVWYDIDTYQNMGCKKNRRILY